MVTVCVVRAHANQVTLCFLVLSLSIFDLSSCIHTHTHIWWNCVWTPRRALATYAYTNRSITASIYFTEFLFWTEKKRIRFLYTFNCVFVFDRFDLNAEYAREKECRRLHFYIIWLWSWFLWIIIKLCYNFHWNYLHRSKLSVIKKKTCENWTEFTRAKLDKYHYFTICFPFEKLIKYFISTEMKIVQYNPFANWKQFFWYQAFKDINGVNANSKSQFIL